MNSDINQRNSYLKLETPFRKPEGSFLYLTIIILFMTWPLFDETVKIRLLSCFDDTLPKT